MCTWIGQQQQRFVDLCCANITVMSGVNDMIGEQRNLRSVDDDVGASAMEVSQTDLGRQPTMACDNHPIFY